ncbi:hypothetical protein ATKI12_8502 [Kitasatospora sp. Ki12]
MQPPAVSPTSRPPRGIGGARPNAPAIGPQDGPPRYRRHRPGEVGEAGLHDRREHGGCDEVRVEVSVQPFGMTSRRVRVVAGLAQVPENGLLDGMGLETGGEGPVLDEDPAGATVVGDALVAAITSLVGKGGPHPYGGASFSSSPSEAPLVRSRRVRGCFGVAGSVHGCLGVVPTRTGIAPEPARSAAGLARSPHARG